MRCEYTSLGQSCIGAASSISLSTSFPTPCHLHTVQCRWTSISFAVHWQVWSITTDKWGRTDYHASYHKPATWPLVPSIADIGELAKGRNDDNHTEFGCYSFQAVQYFMYIRHDFNFFVMFLEYSIMAFKFWKGQWHPPKIAFIFCQAIHYGVGRLPYQYFATASHIFFIK